MYLAIKVVISYPETMSWAILHDLKTLRNRTSAKGLIKAETAYKEGLSHVLCGSTKAWLGSGDRELY